MWSTIRVSNTPPLVKLILDQWLEQETKVAARLERRSGGCQPLRLVSVYLSRLVEVAADSGCSPPFISVSWLRTILFWGNGDEADKSTKLIFVYLASILRGVPYLGVNRRHDFH